MRVLITGGAGFIGSHCVDRFVREGARVVVLDNLDPQVHQGPEAEPPAGIREHIAANRIAYVRGDVRRRPDVERALEDVDTVVHLAAAVGVGQSMYKPYYYMDTNVAGQAMLLETLVAAPSRWRRLVVASSMSLYGEGLYRCPEHGRVAPPLRPIAQLDGGDFEIRCPFCSRTLQPVQTPEDKVLQCSSVYALSKKTQEELALCVGSAYGIPTVALRFFNAYGSRQSLSNPYTGALAIFISRLKNGNAPLIFEDGMQSRDFIHVSDVAEAVWRAASQDGYANDVYNVCTGRATTILEAADTLCRRLGADVRPQIVGRFRAGDIRHCVGDPSKAEKAFGFRASRAFTDGLDELLAWAAGQRSDDSVESSVAELRQHGLIR
jgi:dTDP-L-rhamnose 4-epimerase